MGWLSRWRIHKLSLFRKASVKKNSSRKTHGIDVFYSTRSQLQYYTLDNIVLSVKYTSNPYPVNPSSKFKDHLKDLAHTIECFMSSDLRSQNKKLTRHPS
jgi:hypothetical protein